MQMTAADITPGYYWISDRKRGGEFTVAQVTCWHIDEPEIVVLHPGWEVPDRFPAVLERFDFIARIEPPVTA